MNELILGGQKSGKSRTAEGRAQAWLQSGPNHSAVLLATALGLDDEMRARIHRHQTERAVRVPGLKTVEVHENLAQALRSHSQPHCLVIIDCLLLWLTQCLMPLSTAVNHPSPACGRGVGGEGKTVESHFESPPIQTQIDKLLIALHEASGPVVCVSNEIGLGLSPMSAQTRQFVDALGSLHQRVAQQMDWVTLMVSGLEIPVKRP
jgi:adenosylcobinamide kinase / adenosylcobinamide-phosphate guanylyltransferase